ncbi:MAG: crotonyl-CoA carboxylase/reductase, partial [Pseudonocardiaceae bacterium]|nr:crotonyl-CoA carboxylase/reductase [Pseudonocardiaceae bacterium]
MRKILDVILAGDLASIGSLPVPENYRGVTVHADEVEMFAGRAHEDKDPRESLHVDEVPTPELG